jgi:hypothetical protein
MTLFLYLLVVKHAIADLALQSLIKGGDKLDLKSHKGYRHALDHAALTLLVASWFASVPAAIMPFSTFHFISGLTMARAF